MKKTLLILFLFASIAYSARSQNLLDPYVNVLEKQGQKPINYVVAALDSFDLIIFDDALHTAVEPFDFYQSLLNNNHVKDQVTHIFIEVLSINHQHHINTYLTTYPENIKLLSPVFQDDYSGFGWTLQTYLDLLRTIYQINRQLDANEKYKVIAVSNPVYWESIYTNDDLNLFRKSLIGRDYLMYKVIANELEYFENGKKGIFLTNTRHAYKNIKNGSGQQYWNTATFFYHWHPGKTHSIRIHNVQLYIKSPKKTEASTTEGLDRVEYSLDRMAHGLWDSAFEALGNIPIAISLKDNIFGREPYVGNHMLDFKDGCTMFDAYDALIFLKPLEKLHESASFDFIYTDEFKKELKRRYKIIFNEKQLIRRMKDADVDNLEALIQKSCSAENQKRNSYIKTLSPVDEWKRK